MTRAAAVAAAWIALAGIAAPAAAQHEHHRPRADSAKAVLDAVTVSAERVAVELRSGATVVHARESPAASGSIADLLRTIPGLELDADGRITMHGSAGVLVLIDGRRVALAGDALAAFLRQMPAAALERVEAGTTASVRHGVDGGAGVVNLVLRTGGSRRTAMRSLAGSMASDDHYMGSAAAAGDLGDALGWDVMYSLSGMRPRTDTRTARWSVVPGDLPFHTDQDSRGREGHRLHSVLAGTTVTPSSSSSFSLRGSYASMEGAYRNRSEFVYTNSEGSTSTGTTGSVLEHVIPSGEVGVVASVHGTRARFSSEARASFVDEDFRGDYRDEVGDYTYMTTVMASRQRERVLRNDFGVRVGGIALDGGHESRLRDITTAHDLAHFGATLSQVYRHETSVHAGYLIARRETRGLRTEAGVRVEADRTRTRLATDSVRRAVRLFPSASGEWTDARRALVYRVAYGRRINRPGAEMLNPFSMGGDDMNEIVGNPSLEPEVADHLEAGVARHGARATLQLTPFLRWTRDPIRQIKAATANGGTATTLRNLERMRAGGADGSVRVRATDVAAVTLAGSVAHMETSSDAFRSSGVHAMARLTVDLRVAAQTSVQLYAYQRSAQAIEQGEILPAFTSELSLTHRFSAERGRVTLRLSDPLRTDRVEFRIADTDFTQASRRRAARPLLSLFASYAVGGAPREDAPARTERPASIF